MPDLGANALTDTPVTLVLDTNIVLDLLLFDDPATRGLRQALERGTVRWIGTARMRAEFERVLAYPKLALRMQSPGNGCATLLARFDGLSQSMPEAAQASVRCRDRDDQIFVDLAVAHRADLLSKDRAVLRLHRPLARLGATVHSVWRRWD